MTNFRNLNDYDDVGEIATWIYNTDEFTFNLLFYNDKVRAITAIERLIMSDYINPHHRNFITKLYDENPRDIEGIAVSFKVYDLSIRNTYKALYDTSCTSLPLIIQNSIVGMLFASHIKSNEFYIGNLYTNPEHRKKGVGSKLVKRCIKNAYILKCDAILLDVEFKKPGLLNFYGKLGFMRAENHYHKILGTTYGCYGMKYELK